MKVGFDGVLLGAWTSTSGCQRLLDVGTGTGLVALMLAQRTDVDSTQTNIDAIELDKSAAEEAELNVGRSPWKDRIRVHHGDVTCFAKATPYRYDLIVCNPPFHTGQTSPSAARTKARHHRTLSLERLLAVAADLLSQDGRLALIYPFARRAEICAHAAQRRLVIRRELKVQPNAGKPFHRTLLELQRDSATYQTHQLQTSQLAIEIERHMYTDEFRHLLAPFYLAF